jgi:hypothetical protein
LVVSYDPLLIAAGFFLLAASGALLAWRLRSWLAVVASAAVGYCVVAHLVHFWLQFVPDTRAVPFGQALLRVWLFWPVAILIAGIASLVLVARRRVAL